MHQTICACDEQHTTAADGGGFYVTVRDHDQSGFLLGPYDDHEQALAQVDRGKRLADAADPRAHWYAYGTARVSTAKQPKTVFGR